MSEHRKHKTDDSFMMKVATFIVDKRNLFFLIVILGKTASIHILQHRSTSFTPTVRNAQQTRFR